MPGFTGAAPSTTRSSVSTNASRVSPVGRFDPGGGIICARNLRIIFSEVGNSAVADVTE